MKRYTVKRRYKKIKKRAAASAVAGMTVLGILLGSSFDSPTELLNDNLLNSVPAISDSMLSDSTDDTGDSDSLPSGEERKKGLRARVRERVMAMPYLVRACVGIPLWCIGWLILSAAGLLWEPVLSPLASTLVNCLCLVAILLCALTITVKSAFPDMPIKKVLSRRSLSTVFIGALLFGAVGALMQIFLPEYERLKDIVEGVIILAILTAAAVPLLKKEAKRRREAADIAENTIPRRDERKMILELADSAR